MNETRQKWFLAGAVLGVLFALLNLVNLVAIEGDATRDAVAIGLGVACAIVAYARYRGWKGALR
jgi:uncharacterized membrane protein